MKKLFTTLTIVLTIAATYGQNLGLTWVGNINGNIHHNSHSSMTADQNGNVYCVGRFMDVADFDPSLLSNYNLSSPSKDNFFIFKWDFNGVFAWAKNINASSQGSGGYSLGIDSQGDVIVTGYFNGTADFDPDPNSTFVLSSSNAGTTTLDAAFLMKLNSNGQFVWAKTIAQYDPLIPNDQLGICLAIDNSDNIIAGGSFRYTNDFDDGPGVVNLVNNTFTNETYIAKFSTNGSLIWAKEFDNLNNEAISFPFSIDTDNIGNVYVAGEFSGDVDFNPTGSISAVYSTPDFSDRDGYLMKLDNTGAFNWFKQLGTIGARESALSVQTSTTGNVYVGGCFSGSLDFNPGATPYNLTSNGLNDGYVAKYSSNGNIVWANAYGGINQDVVGSISIDNSENAYVGGSFSGTVNFDPGSTNFTLNSNSSAFILKTNTSGNFLFVEELVNGSIGHIEHASGSTYLYGDYNGNTNFDLGANSNYQNGSGIYVAKYCESVLPPVITANPVLTCTNSGVLHSNYPNNNLWNTGETSQSISVTDPGTYILNVEDINGCQTSTDFEVLYPVDIELTANIIQPCSYDESSITVSANGGAGPYSFIWDNGTIGNQLSGVPVGEYTVVVTDANGCQASATYVLESILQDSDFDYPNGIIVNNTTAITDVNGDQIIKVKGTILIPSGIHFIMNNLVIEFGHDTEHDDIDQGLTHSGIIVREGASLTASNCKFKGVSDCDAMWEGIQVWGDDCRQIVLSPSDELTGVVYVPCINDNGMLTLTDCTIMDAHIGICVHRKNLPYTNNHIEYGRGTLHAIRTKFINNYVSLSFNSKPGIVNNSRIEDCEFVCNSLMIDQYKYPTEGMFGFVQLRGVVGPFFGANSFKGNTNLNIDKRGYGILSHTSSYKVQSSIPPSSIANPSPNLKKNTFENLSVGIETYGNGALGNNILIKDNIFRSIYQNITTNGSTFDEISFNNFNVPVGTLNFNSWAIFLLNNSGYLVTENSINSTQSNIYTYGIINRDVTNSLGEVYKNIFSGDFVVATQVEGNSNQTIQLNCNKYTGNNDFDWAIVSNDMIDQGACNNLPSDASTNEFGLCNNPNFSQIFSNAVFEYNSSLPYLPNCYDNNTVTVNSCPFIGLPPNYNQYCPVKSTNPCINCTVELLSNINSLQGLYREKTKSEYIRKSLQENKIDEVIEFLKSEGGQNDYKLLIPTFYNLNDFDSARIYLDSINIMSSEDQQFVDLFNMLLNIQDDNRTIFEINPTELQFLNSIASSHSSVVISVNSILNLIDNQLYIRFPEQLNIPGNFGVKPLNTAENYSTQRKFNIYPNPSSDEVFISVSNGEEVSCQVFNTCGKLILSVDKNNNHEIVRINKLPKGMYIVRITFDDGSFNQEKLVIE